jgi:thiol-disulfide isomerase/thioredoxin
MNRGALIIGGVLLLILLVIGYVAYSIRSERIAEERDKAADVLFSEQAREAYTDMEGREVRLDSYDEKVVVVTSWASWCPQCAGELTLLNQLANEKNDDRLHIIAINRNEDKYQAQRFMATLPEFPRIQFVLDNQDYFFDSVEGYAMPETIFYNEAGEIVFHKRGNLTADEIKNGFSAALGEVESQ